MSRVLAIAALAAALAAGAFAAGGERKRIEHVPADQAAARATVLRRVDIGRGWKGGPTRPDRSPPPTCPNYHPRQSDLVETGIADSRFARGPSVVSSEVQILRRARMVALDWQRSVLAPGAVSCQGRDIARSLGRGDRLISFRRIRFPRFARYTAAFRGLIAFSTQRRVFFDIVLVGRRRTEITLDVLGPASARGTLGALERRLARRMLSRARA